MLPFTPSVAPAFAAEGAHGAVPGTLLPKAKVTLPVGAALQLAGLTVAVTSVVAVA